MKESTAQRTSRIANEDAGAHSAYAHSQDFYNGLATYNITQEKSGWFTVYVDTPHGRTTTNRKTLAEAQSVIADWKADTHFAGYPKHFFIKE
jgi:hypothetical protein